MRTLGRWLTLLGITCLCLLCCVILLHPATQRPPPRHYVQLDWTPCSFVDISLALFELSIFLWRVKEEDNLPVIDLRLPLLRHFVAPRGHLSLVNKTMSGMQMMRVMRSDDEGRECALDSKGWTKGWTDDPMFVTDLKFKILRFFEPKLLQVCARELLQMREKADFCEIIGLWPSDGGLTEEDRVIMRNVSLARRATEEKCYRFVVLSISTAPPEDIVVNTVYHQVNTSTLEKRDEEALNLCIGATVDHLLLLRQSTMLHWWMGLLSSGGTVWAHEMAFTPNVRRLGHWKDFNDRSRSIYSML